MAIEHRFIHIDVDNLRTVFDLLAGDGEGFFVFAIQNHAGEYFRTRHIGTLPHIHEKRAVTNLNRLQTGKAHRGNGGGDSGIFNH